MATLLPSIDSRQVVRCDRCNLTQFPNSSNLCRRCHLSLEDEPEVAAPAPELAVVPRYRRGYGNGDLAEVGELLRDKFLRELLPLAQKLNQAQRLVVLTHVSDLAAEASRRRVVRA